MKKQAILFFICIVCFVAIILLATTEPKELTQDFVENSTPTPTANVIGDPTPTPTDVPTSTPTAAPNLDPYKAERDTMLAKIDKMIAQYMYDEAIAEIQAKPHLANSETDARIQKANDLKSSLVKYDGKLYHIFFHSLVVYPELAFDYDSDHYTYWDYMATVTEFKRILPLLYEAGYVLFDYDYIVEFDANGKATYKDIYLPAGKKPVIISFDDVNYYEYMKDDGFADCLAINEKGDLVNKITRPDGTVEYSYEADGMPILNTFVDQYPDFSYKGAKGIVALTGYEGAFGYHYTKMSGAEKDAAIAECKKIADKLKEDGWKIACHSYTHKSSFTTETITAPEIAVDNTRWLNEVGQIVGETNLYISPFGAYFTDARRDEWVKSGFTIIMPVYYIQDYYKGSTLMVHNRCNIDGITMVNHPERLTEFFDASKVVDEKRPAR